MHHDAQIMMSRMVAANGIYKRHITYKPIFFDMAAKMKSFIKQIVANHGDIKNIANIGIKNLCCNVTEKCAENTQDN